MIIEAKLKYALKEMLRTPHGMLVSLLGVIVRKPQETSPKITHASVA